MVTSPSADVWRTDDVDDLCAALMTLETADEFALFLRDLCTYREIDEFASRWAIARLLASGMPYRGIAEATGASTATVTRVNQWRHHGAGGYEIAMSRTGDSNV